MNQADRMMIRDVLAKFLVLKFIRVIAVIDSLI